MSSSGQGESRVQSCRVCGNVGCGQTLGLPSPVWPPFSLVVMVPCVVVPILSTAFRVAGSCSLAPVEGCGFGSSAVLQKEPIGDLCRGFAPFGDEALSA